MAARFRLGVLGWPVSHSRSPSMHNVALAACGLNDWRYSLLPVPPYLLAETVRSLPGRGFRGVNVTIPHKESVLGLADRASPAARAIGAANTLLFETGGQDGNQSVVGDVLAENTDAPALISALPFTVAGCRALILGAGGTARAVVWALRHAGAVEVLVWNRHPERARSLCSEVGGTAVTELPSPAAGVDLLVNCTPAGMEAGAQQFKSLPLNADALSSFRCVVDYVYQSDETPLISAARRHSIPVVDGLELLVRQGALSFTLFTGLEAPIELMRAAAHAANAEVTS